jgi:hypothetical protein
MRRLRAHHDVFLKAWGLLALLRYQGGERQGQGARTMLFSIRVFLLAGLSAKRGLISKTTLRYFRPHVMSDLANFVAAFGY